MVAAHSHFAIFSLRRLRRDKVARARAVFPTQGAGLFPKRLACPLQQHCSLLIEKKQAQIHPSCLHSQSPSLYLLLSLSPFGSFPFCLVYFLMYKSNVSDRTFFFQSKKKDNNSALYLSLFFLAIALWLCGNVLFTMLEREIERQREKGVGALPGDAGNKTRHGGQAEGGMESCSVTCPRFSSR